MEEQKNAAAPETAPAPVKDLIRQAIQEFVATEQTKAEPAYKTELVEERRRRESLEKRVNELVEENRRSRQAAEEAERHSAIRSELQKLGVTKVDLAFRAVKDDIRRAEDGRLLAVVDGGAAPLREYLEGFVHENPELLPARIAAGSPGGAHSAKNAAPPPSVDIDKIRPGMSPEEYERVRQEIARVAQESLRGV
jgi:hypothetical protein